MPKIDKVVYTNELNEIRTILKLVMFLNKYFNLVIDTNNEFNDIITRYPDIYNDIETLNAEISRLENRINEHLDNYNELVNDLGDLGDEVSGKLDKTGGTLTGNLNIGQYALQGSSNGVIRDLIHFDVNGALDIGSTNTYTNINTIGRLKVNNNEVAYLTDSPNLYKYTFYSKNYCYVNLYTYNYYAQQLDNNELTIYDILYNICDNFGAYSANSIVNAVDGYCMFNDKYIMGMYFDEDRDEIIFVDGNETEVYSFDNSIRDYLVADILNY